MGEASRRYGNNLDTTAPDAIDREGVLNFWFRMDTVSRTFEDVAREWGLPTALGQASCYPPGWLDEDWKPLPPEQRQD